MTHLHPGDEDLHDETYGEHRGTARTANGRDLEQHERRIKTHLAEHQRIASDLARLCVPVDSEDGVRYEPWTNGTVIGLRCISSKGPDEYIYFNPSESSDDGVNTVFVYHGTFGDPAIDSAFIHAVIHDGAVNNEEDS